jgi:FkbM family methyltransferase
MSSFTKNASTLFTTPSMVPWWLRWQGRRFGIPSAVAIPGGGHIMSFRNFSDFWSISRMVPTQREYLLMKRVVTAGTVNFDVGANVGVFTVAMSSSSREATVYAFEPTPDTFNRLEKNVELNRLKNVELRQIALGSEQNRALFQTTPTSPATNRLASPGVERQHSIEVEVQTVDGVLRRSGAQRLGLLKIDVEGFESDVLMGAAESIRENRWAAILIEVCPGNLRMIGRSITDLFALCTALDLSFFEISQTGHKGREMTARELESSELTNVLLARCDM